MPLQIAATDSVPGRTLTYSATGLPPGLSINTQLGLIIGTPTTAGSYSPVVTVTDNTGITGQVSFPWTIKPSGGGGTGNKAFIGAIVDPVYGGSGTNLGPAMTTFDGRVGRPMAESCFRIYFGNPTFSKGTSGTPGQWPTNTNNPKPVQSIYNQMVAAGTGGKVAISFRPAIDFTNAYTAAVYQTEFTNLSNAVKLFKNANINFDVTLWHECNNTFLNGMATDGSTFHNMWSFYASAVTSHNIPLVYTCALNSGGSPKAYTMAVPFVPTSPVPSAITADWYSNDFFHAGVTMTAIENKADSLGVPFGMTEFGPSNDPSNFTPTHAQWYNGPNDHTSFIQTIIDIFSARLAAGKNNWDLMYYSDVANNTAIGYIGSSSDYKVPGLQAMFDTLAVN